MLFYVHELKWISTPVAPQYLKSYRPNRTRLAAPVTLSSNRNDEMIELVIVYWLCLPWPVGPVRLRRRLWKRNCCRSKVAVQDESQLCYFCPLSCSCLCVLFVSFKRDKKGVVGAWKEDTGGQESDRARSQMSDCGLTFASILGASCLIKIKVRAEAYWGKCDHIRFLGAFVILPLYYQNQHSWYLCANLL